MTTHDCVAIDEEDDGWWVLGCACGWETPRVEVVHDGINHMMDHAADAACEVHYEVESTPGNVLIEAVDQLALGVANDNGAQRQAAWAVIIDVASALDAQVPVPGEKVED